jgi:hypothetical protein
MFEQLLESVARGLERLRIPYMLIGGQAVLLAFDVEYIHHWLREFDRSLCENSLERFEDLRKERQS